MGKVKRRKKKNGSVGYAIFLTLWILLLFALSYVGLKMVWRMAEYYEAAEVSPVINEYIENLDEEMWDKGIADTVASMSHEFQTDEECIEVLRTVLKLPDPLCDPVAGTVPLACGEREVLL